MKILFETKREAMYRNIKYWGKKPHNIWSELIEENTNEGEIVFDPFLGSNVSFFESIILNRIPIGVDINPLSGFIAEIYSETYEKDKINEIYKQIKLKITKNEYYDYYYANKECDKCHKKNTVSNYVWHNNKRIECRFRCKYCGHDSSQADRHIAYKQVPENKWIPYFDLRQLSLINENSIRLFGGHNITNIYTDANLYINILIFDQIMALEEPYKKLFVLIFLQMIHLTTKMCAVRSAESGRLYSSSWGRPAFLALSKFMEQNPLIQLERSIYGNSGILNAIESVDSRISNFELLTQNRMSSSDFRFLSVEKPTIINGDSKTVYLRENTVDFIITDPPYGNIIQYGELSTVWNTWLRIAYNCYNIDLNDEVIVNKYSDYVDYFNDLLKVFDNCYMYLKEDRKMVFTFNSNIKEDWDVLVKLLLESDFCVEDIYLQKNLRASEANVTSKKGMAISDYYIVLRKNSAIPKDDRVKRNKKQIRKLESIRRNH